MKREILKALGAGLFLSLSACGKYVGKTGAAKNIDSSRNEAGSSDDVYLTSDQMSAGCDSKVCDVLKFDGTTDEKIAKAIQAAQVYVHHTVYFPNGTYLLNRSIQFLDSSVNLKLVGESAKETILISAPIIVELGEQQCFASIFNIDRPGGYDYLNLSIEKMTLDYNLTHEHEIYTEAGCSGGAHGVRVGNGWSEGKLRIADLNILSPPGYGIGIQNSGKGDIPANNVTIDRIYVKNSGMDAFDSKRPAEGNKFLTITNMLVDQIGFNDEGTAVGIDIRYDHFHLENISIITDSQRPNPRGLATNVGILFREATSHGSVHNVYVKGTNHGIFFEGKTEYPNDDISIDHFIVKNYTGTGIYIRGKNHSITDGCSFSGLGQRDYYISTSIADLASLDVDISDKSGCPSYEDIGAHF